MPRELDRGHADPAGGGVDEDRFAGPEPGQVGQRVVGGEEGDRDGGGLGEGPSGGDVDQQAVVDDRRRAQHAGKQAHDTVAGGEAGDVRADVHDHTGAFRADAGLPRVDAQGDEHVPEVHPGRARREANLPAGQRLVRFGVGHQSQRVEGAGGGDGQPPGRGVQGRDQCVCPGRVERGQVPVGAVPGQPGDVDLPTTQGELPLAGGQRGRERVQGVRVVVEVEQDELAGMFGLRRADQAPDAGGGKVADVLPGAGGDRVVGDHDQPRGGVPVVGRPGLQHGQRLPGGRVRSLRAGGGWARQEHGVGYRGSRGDGRGERGQVRADLDRWTCRRRQGGQAQGVRSQYGPPTRRWDLAGHIHHRPGQLEQRLLRHPTGTGEMIRRGHPQHQGADGGDGRAGEVAGPQRHPVGAGRLDVHPQPAGTCRGQRHAADGKGEPDCVRRVLPVALGLGLSLAGGDETHRRVQRGVQQRRMQPEPACVGLLLGRQVYLGEHIVPAPPGGSKPLEDRPVVVASGGQTLVEACHVHRGRARGRPGPGQFIGRRYARDRVSAGQDAGRVPRPRSVRPGSLDEGAGRA